jgi:cysteinyl-tRNA synthetase
MTLSLYDSKSQQVRAFIPINAGRVGIYVCGPTVQGAPHVGHLRSALVYDILRRWLEATGNKVTLVRNVTDIDDKVLENAKANNEDWWALAYHFEQEFNAAYRKIGIQSPTYEPRATGAIPEMLEIIDRLIERGYAYATEDGSVYFESAKWQKYGELTNQKLADMEASESGETGKRNAHDFALWKAAKAGEPASAGWDSKFGRGRPGWHIECSAM